MSVWKRGRESRGYRRAEPVFRGGTVATSVRRAATQWTWFEGPSGVGD